MTIVNCIKHIDSVIKDALATSSDLKPCLKEEHFMCYSSLFMRKIIVRVLDPWRAGPQYRI